MKACQGGISTDEGHFHCPEFNNLRSFHSFAKGLPHAFSTGMDIWFLWVAAQVIVLLVGLVRERGEDSAFTGDKLGFRS